MRTTEENAAMVTRKADINNETVENRHVCPWWLGYFLSCPLRRFLENPEKILGPHVHAGMTVVEPGCGMGFFTLPLARMVGPSGRVVCIDIQKRMIARLMKRAEKAGLADRIETRICNGSDLGLQDWEGKVDLVAAIHVIHEVPNVSAFLRQAYELLKPSSRLLILEPRGHVDAEAFQDTLVQARRIGFRDLESPKLRGEHTATLEKCVEATRL
jgi:ubiquinone/menaquinone biosynthesis C-methylase UbiE